MQFRKNVLKKAFLPLACSLLFLFLCLYRLPESYAVNGDMARDSLQSLRILKVKDITFIGPPLSIGQLGTRVTYFSSAIYYIGALGFALSSFSVLGPVVLIALINASALFPLYEIVKKKSPDNFLQLLGLLAYTTSPIVVLYSRLFWNPSPLIGLGVWGMYFLGRSSVLFGIVAALAVYFHYFGAALFMFGMLWYVLRKELYNSLKLLSTWLLLLSPFILFEIRNKFYLTTSFLVNARAGETSIVSTWQEHLKFFLELPVHLLGLLPDPFASRLLLVGPAAMWIGLGFWLLLSYKNRKNHYVYFLAAVALLTSLASYSYIRIQYFFIAIGALGQLSGFVSSQIKKGILIALILLQSVNTTYAITRPVHVSRNEAFLTIAQLEEVSEHISQTHQSGKSVNITENIRGDARAQYIRFFLERDGLPDLRNELDYQHLDELYVLTPSIQKTYKENRWEFTAGGATQLVSIHEVGQWQVLKFQKPLNQ